MNERMVMAQRELLFHLRGYFPTTDFMVMIEGDNQLRIALSLRERTEYNLLNNVQVHVTLGEHTNLTDGRFAKPLGPILVSVERFKNRLDESLGHKALTKRLFDTQGANDPYHMVMGYNVRSEEVAAVGIADRNMNPVFHFAPVILSCSQTKHINQGRLFANRLNLLLLSTYTRAQWLTQTAEGES